MLKTLTLKEKTALFEEVFREFLEIEDRKLSREVIRGTISLIAETLSKKDQAEFCMSISGKLITMVAAEVEEGHISPDSAKNLCKDFKKLQGMCADKVGN